MFFFFPILKIYRKIKHIIAMRLYKKIHSIHNRNINKRTTTWNIADNTMIQKRSVM